MEVWRPAPREVVPAPLPSKSAWEVPLVLKKSWDPFESRRIWSPPDALQIFRSLANNPYSGEPEHPLTPVQEKAARFLL